MPRKKTYPIIKIAECNYCKRIFARCIKNGEMALANPYCSKACLSRVRAEACKKLMNKNQKRVFLAKKIAKKETEKVVNIIDEREAKLKAIPNPTEYEKKLWRKG